MCCRDTLLIKRIKAVDYVFAGSYSQVMGLVIDFLDHYPREARESILGGTAQKLWRLGVS